MDLSLDFTEEEVTMLNKFSNKYDIPINEFIKSAVLSRIKDEIDMEVYENAARSYNSKVAYIR